jgi:AbrB family looped-hinge helix DNA binding protein
MTTAIVTSRGQITIPASVRDAMKLEAGSRVEFVEAGNGQFLIAPAIHSVQLLKGVLQKPKTTISIEQKNLAITNKGVDK